MSLFGKDETHGKITVIAQIRAKSGHEDEVRSAFKAVVGPSQKEAGCLSYNLFEDAHYTGSFFTIGYNLFEDAHYTGSFFTIEEWESEDALDTHFQVNNAALDKAKALLREDLRISVLKQLA